MKECKKCGSQENYNFDINNSPCNSCIEEELEILRADNEKHKKQIEELKKDHWVKLNTIRCTLQSRIEGLQSLVENVRVCELKLKKELNWEI